MDVWWGFPPIIIPEYPLSRLTINCTIFNVCIVWYISSFSSSDFGRFLYHHWGMNLMHTSYYLNEYYNLCWIQVICAIAYDLKHILRINIWEKTMKLISWKWKMYLEKCIGSMHANYFFWNGNTTAQCVQNLPFVSSRYEIAHIYSWDLFWYFTHF